MWLTYPFAGIFPAFLYLFHIITRISTWSTYLQKLQTLTFCMDKLKHEELVFFKENIILNCI